MFGFQKKIFKVNFVLGDDNEKISKTINFMTDTYITKKHGFDKIIFDMNYPELKKILDSIKEENLDKKYILVKNTIEDYFNDFFTNKKSDLLIIFNQFIEDWNKIHKSYIEVVCNLLKIKIPNKQITIYMSFNPISPRYLNDWSFPMFYKKERVLRKIITAHEIFHYLYFEKIKQLFKGINERSFNSPYLEWHLSEILDAVILAHTTEIQGLLDDKEKKQSQFMGYKEHKNAKIEGKTFVEYFRDLYLENYINYENKNIDEFLILAHKEIYKHKDNLAFSQVTIDKNNKDLIKKS